MIKLLTGLGSKVWGYVAAAGGIVIAFLAVYFKGKNAAHQEIKEETVETVIETHEEVRENEKEIRDLGGSDDDERQRLREKYYRD